MLLQNKADPSSKDSHGRTPLHCAAMSSCSESIIALLNFNPDLIQITDNYNRTALFYTVFNTNAKLIDITRVLIEKKANLNHKDVEGKTALHHACQSSKSRIIPVLLKNGADATIKDKSRKTPGDYAQTDKVRDYLVVYGTAQFQQSEQDMQLL